MEEKERRGEIHDCSSATEKKNLWHIDSGFSKHMTGDPNKFIRLRKYNKGKVTFGDNMPSKIIDKDTIAINNKIKAEMCC